MICYCLRGTIWTIRMKPIKDEWKWLSTSIKERKRKKEKKKKEQKKERKKERKKKGKKKGKKERIKKETNQM